MSSISNKVVASTVAAALVTIIVWGASLAGLDIPEVSARGSKRKYGRVRQM